jgi:hypothetical protein
MRISPVIFPALAALAAPAIASGDNVVMLSVAHVGVPQKLPGLCLLDGAVRHVWQGHAFHEGQSLSLKIPCGNYDFGPLPPAMSLHGFRLTDPAVLRKSTLGAAHLDDAGNLMWQPARGDGARVIWGYRVLDGVSLRLGHSA